MTEGRVLVVEDEPQIADLYADRLDDEGYEVVVENTVGAGIDRADDAFDVAVLDRRLPDGTGADVLETLRDRDLDVRVAMVTAVEPDFDILDMGFDLYLLKPISGAGLVDAVETLFTRAEYDEKLRETASLVSKQAILETEKPAEELERNEDYQRLVARIEDLDTELEELTEQFNTEDYRTMFREIGRA